MRTLLTQKLLAIYLVCGVAGSLVYLTLNLLGHSQTITSRPCVDPTPTRLKRIPKVRQPSIHARDNSSVAPAVTESKLQPEVRNGVSAEDIIGMASRDPMAAIKLAQMLPAEERMLALRGIVEVWAKVDGAGCYNWVMASEASKEKTSLLIGTMTSIANTQNPQLLFSLIGSTPKGVLKDVSIFYVFQDLAACDMERALALARDLSDEHAARGVAEKLGRIGARQGMEEVSKMLEDIPHGYFRDYFVSSAIESAGKADPAKALEWVLANPKLCDAANSIGNLSTAFALNSPLDGLELAAGIKDGKLRELFIQNLGATWAQNKPEEAGKWLIKQISETDYSSNETIAVDIMHRWIQSDPQMALSQISSIPDVPARNQAMIAALEAYSTFDPQAAAAKVGPFLTSNSPESEKAISEIADNWLRRDPLEASKWIGSMKDGPLKDASIGQLVSNILSKDQDYQMANLWANQIGSMEKRNEVLQSLQKQETQSRAK